MIATLLWGALGGWLFSLAGIPLAWMIGSMFFTAGIAVAGVRLKGPGKGRAIMITVLGVMLGSAFTPDVLEQASSWILSIAVLIVFVVVITVFLSWAFQKFGKMTKFEAGTFGNPRRLWRDDFDRCESYGVDVRAISLIHATRVMFTVMLIPLYFRIFEGYQPPKISPMGSVTEMGLQDGLILAACAFVGLCCGEAPEATRSRRYWVLWSSAPLFTSWALRQRSHPASL